MTLDSISFLSFSTEGQLLILFVDLPPVAVECIKGAHLITVSLRANQPSIELSRQLRGVGGGRKGETSFQEGLTELKVSQGGRAALDSDQLVG